MTERNIYSNRRATERARAITAMKRREAAKKRKIAISAVAATLVIAVIAGIAVLGTSLISNQVNATVPTTIGKLAMTDPTTQSAVATQPVSEAPAQKVTSSPTDNNNSNNNNSYNGVNDNNTGNTHHAQPAEAPENTDKGYSGGISADGVIYDQRHEVPANTGTPLHYYATGKTSGGYDWDYTADNGNFSVCCNYNTLNNQYDFIIYGKAQGTAHITLYYFTADNVKVPAEVTVYVDENLNVTQA